MGTLDPKNPVAVYFFIRAGINPAFAPEPPKKEPVWKELGSDPKSMRVDPVHTRGQKSFFYWY
jgi:hypothetical protein